MEQNPYRTKVELSPAWKLVGGLMFVVALGAPIAMIRLASDPSIETADTVPWFGPSGAAAAEARPGEREMIREALAGAVIEPGSGIGPLRLGARYALAKRDGPNPDEVAGEGWRLLVTTEGDDARISALELVTAGCEALAHDLPRPERLPATEDAISIGTHVSRISLYLHSNAAAPESGDGVGTGTVHLDGMQLSICPDSGLVSAIRVEPMADGTPVAAAAPQPPAEMALGEPSDLPLAMVDAPSRPAVNRAAGRLTEPATPSAEAIRAVSRPEENAPRVTPIAPLHWDLSDAVTTHDSTDGDDPVRVVGTLAIADWDAGLALPASVAGMQAETVEEALALAAAERRNLQLRLSVLGFNPNGIDGVFGPQTRSAIRAAQERLGRVPTGYLDASLIAEIESLSEPKLAALKNRKRTKSAAEPASETLTARVPSPKQSPNCRRNENGEITENQSIGCDLAILEESLSALFSSGG